MDLVFLNSGSSSCFLLLSCFCPEGMREVAVARHFLSRALRVGLGRCVRLGPALARTRRTLVLRLHPREEPSIRSTGTSTPHVRAPQVARRGASVLG